MKQRIYMKVSALKRITACLLLAAFPLLGSCVLEEVPDQAADTFEAEFTISLPDKQSTRALDTQDEEKVSDIDILVFDSTTQRSLYKVKVASVSQTGSTVKFTTRLRKVDGITGNYDFIILANTRELYPGDLAAGQLKETVRTNLTDKVTAGTGWITDKSDADYRSMPMWGELTNQPIAVKQYASTLTRMTVKINVLVDMDSSSNDTFEMEEVWLCNYNSTGYIVPKSDHWNPSSKYVTEPTVDGISATTGVTNGIDYTWSISSDKQSLTNTIYAFESPAGSTAAYKSNICILIKGTWTPDGGAAQTGWYRMDFANTDPSTMAVSYLPLKRNHAYTVKITTVNGAGYSSKPQAYDSLPINITNTVQEWADGKQNNIFTDGQYMLGVSRIEYQLTRESRNTGDTDNKLTVTTNHSYGWSAAVWADEAGTTKSGSSWLTLSQYSNTGNYPTGNTVSLLITDNTGAGSRTAWVHIKAGRMTAKVKVVQTHIASTYFISTDGFKNGTRGANTISALVKSNAPWTLVAIEDLSNVLQTWGPTSGQGNRNGEHFTYTFKDSALDGIIRFTFQITPPSGVTQQATGEARATIFGSFARSNVVRNGSATAATFAITQDDNTNIPANVQGLLFRYGSLVGLDGVSGTTNRLLPYGSSSHSISSMPYVAAADALDQFDGYGTSGKGYYTTTSGSDRNKGDICRWISDQSSWISAGKGKWRMPTENEYRLLYSQTIIISNALGKKTSATFVGLSTSNTEGKSTIPHGFWLGEGLDYINASSDTEKENPPMGTIFLPASGYRNGEGSIYYVGLRGYGWSATNTSSNVYNLYFINEIYMDNGFNRTDFQPVRCIRAD